MAEDYQHLIKTLKEGEDVVTVFRRHGFAYALPFAIGFILLALPFFFTYVLFRQGIIGLFIFFVGVAVGILIIVRTSFLRKRNVFVLTNQRLIDINQYGFFSRTVSEAQLTNIQDVSARVRGVAQTMFRYGTVYVQTAGSAARLELDHVSKPDEVKDIITDWQARAGEEVDYDGDEEDGDDIDLSPEHERLVMSLRPVYHRLGARRWRALIKQVENEK